MSEYIVSARKYRPENFGTLIGQDNIAVTLKNSILRGQLAHAYLFCGPRGVGKTTTARIFAKMINCSSPSADMEPCGECESCRSFAEGRSYCIHELDAASNNGVDDIKALIDQVRIPPQVGRYSVYIIDEVHMLSSAAFNAFLKTLEEPPAHAIFILATTEKHKILPTILSRCQTYDFNRITVDNIVRNLRMIAGRENISVDDESLHVIAQKADGAMRDALTIFDQTVAFCGTEVHYEDVIRNLNVLSHEHCFALVENFLAGDHASALLKFDEILAKGFNALHFVAALSAHFRDLIVSRSAGLDALLELPESLKIRYREQAQRCSLKFLYDALAITAACESGYRASVNPRLHIEFALMRLSWLIKAPQPQAEPSGAQAQTVASATQQQSAAQQTGTIKAMQAPHTQAAAQASQAPQGEQSHAEPAQATVAQPESAASTVQQPVQPKVAEAAALQPTPALEQEAQAPRRRRGAAAQSGFSLGSLLNQEQSSEQVEAVDLRTDRPSDEEVVARWKECAEIFADKPRLANAISTSETVIGDTDGHVHLTFLVSNSSQVEWIRANALSKLEQRLKQLLNWPLVKLEVAVGKAADTAPAAYTPEEKLAEMVQANPELRKFISDIDGALK